ncbi:MAG: ComF family protein [Proteobacteria bacterium]|nr:ComF family protein [Pseudomonadota bacterium]
MNHFLSKIKGGLSGFFSFIADERCLGCGRESGFICKNCYSKITFNKNFCCYCAYPLPDSIEKSICGSCLNSKPLFSKTVAPFIYEGIVREILLSAKFSGNYYYYERLINQFWDEFENLLKAFFDAEVIVPVPLSRKRLIERGYNQAGLIAKYLSKKLNKPVILSALSKTIETKPQSQLGERERHSNIKNAFCLKKTINFSKIIIVDDIITTSATVSEVTKVLKKGGVNEVYIFSLCRAVF